MITLLLIEYYETTSPAYGKKFEMNNVMILWYDYPCMYEMLWYKSPCIFKVSGIEDPCIY